MNYRDVKNLKCCTSSETKTYHGQVYIPDDHIQLISKYYTGANLNLSFDIPVNGDADSECGTKKKKKSMKSRKKSKRRKRSKKRCKCCQCNDRRTNTEGQGLSNINKFSCKCGKLQEACCEKKIPECCQGCGKIFEPERKETTSKAAKQPSNSYCNCDQEGREKKITDSCKCCGQMISAQCEELICNAAKKVTIVCCDCNQKASEPQVWNTKKTESQDGGRKICCCSSGCCCGNSTGGNRKVSPDKEEKKIEKQVSKIDSDDGGHSAERGVVLNMPEKDDKSQKRSQLKNDRKIYAARKVSSLENDEVYGKYWYHRPPLIDEVDPHCEEWDEPINPKVGSSGRRYSEPSEPKEPVKQSAGLCLNCKEPMCFVCKNYVCYCSCNKPNFVICNHCNKKMTPRKKRPCPPSEQKQRPANRGMDNEAMMFLLPMLASMQGNTNCQSCIC